MGTTVLSLLHAAIIICCCSDACGAVRPISSSMSSAASAPEKVVSRFLNAWLGGRFDEVWQCLDTASRDRVSAEALAKAYSIPVDAFPAEEQSELRPLIVGQQVILPRPLSMKKVSLHKKSDKEAWVDCEVTTTILSSLGIKGSSLIRDALLQSLQEKDGLDKGAWILLFVLLGDGSEQLDAAKTVRTAAGETTDYRSLLDERITLHVRRYELIREKGEWRIANAVTVSETPAKE